MNDDGVFLLCIITYINCKYMYFHFSSIINEMTQRFMPGKAVWIPSTLLALWRLPGISKTVHVRSRVKDVQCEVKDIWCKVGYHGDAVGTGSHSIMTLDPDENHYWCVKKSKHNLYQNLYTKCFLDNKVYENSNLCMFVILDILPFLDHRLKEEGIIIKAKTS